MSTNMYACRRIHYRLPINNVIDSSHETIAIRCYGMNYSIYVTKSR